MRNGHSSQEYSETPPVRRCEHCGEPLLTQRRGAKWCSREHKELAREARKRASDRVARLRKNHPFADAARFGEPDHWADMEAGRIDPELQEFSDFNNVSVYEDQDDGIHAVDHRAPDPWEERNAAFNEQTRLTAAIERIEAEYSERARPYIDQLRHNPGVRPTGPVRLEQECADKIAALEKPHQLAQALEWSAQSAPQRQVTAHERAVEQAAARAFGMDLGRGRFLRADPEPAGRDVHQKWIW